MGTTTLAILPIFGVILMGFALRYFRAFPDSFWPMAERMTYYVFFPALLIHGMAGREFVSGTMPLVFGLMLSILFVGGLLIFLQPYFARYASVDEPAFTSLFQGGLRPNTYVGLSLAAALQGPDWMSMSAVAMLAIIPLMNVICVLTLSRFGTKGSATFGYIFKQLITNPLILGCSCGLFLNVMGWSIPAVVGSGLDILGRGALSMGLLAAGAGLRLGGLLTGWKCVAISSFVHLIVLPLVAIALITLFGGSSLAVQTGVFYTAIPVSISSYILARQMGGDHDVMAHIITVQTLLSVITLPLFVQLVSFG